MFASVAPLLRLPRNCQRFDYCVPENLVSTVAIGQLVEMPFRANTRAKGIVMALYESAPAFRVKNILRVVGASPLLGVAQLALADWIARETFTAVGVVLRSFLPTLRLSDITTLPLLSSPVDAPQKSRPTLLHYRTKSARNEYYRERIQETLGKNRSVIIVVPRAMHIEEIANALQLFSDYCIQISPKLKDKDRWQLWKTIRSLTRPRIIIGTRSVIFSPVADLGLIIVDREHDENLKQEEPNPRYHAREAALALAQFSNATIILGSPTPSIETYYRAREQKYELVVLGAPALPNLQLIRMDDERKKERFSYIAPILQDEITQTIKSGKSVFLLVDRLGTATYLQCKDCAYEFRCSDCDNPLVLHKETGYLLCRRCGAKDVPALECPHCKSVSIAHRGYGTERIAELVATFSSRYDVIRLDSQKPDQAPALKLDEHPTIIVGTSFAIPYLNENALGLIAILTADQSLQWGEFRSQEHAYQMFVELGSYAPLLIQTSNADHWIYESLANNYEWFYNKEIASRQEWNYPPFGALIKLIMQNVDRKANDTMAQRCVKRLQSTLKDVTVSDPYPLSPYRVRGRWRTGILIKLPMSITYASLSLASILSPDVIIDVNPNSVT